MKGLKGLSSNSSSPTDTWVASFKDGTFYEDHPITQGFIKMWIDNKQNESLDYERTVYETIIRNLIDFHVCPNFIRFLGSGKKCTFDAISKIVQVGVPNKSHADMQLKRNLYFMQSQKLNRPSVTTANTGKYNGHHKKYLNANTDKYNMIVNEMIPENTSTWRQYFRTEFRKSGSVITTDIWRIIFQIVIGCYAMSMSRMTHNDLHYENIWIVPLNKDTVFTYNLNHEVHNFESKYIAKIFDFDRAYVKDMGSNNILDAKMETYSQWNKFIPNLDIIKFFGYVFNEGVRMIPPVLANTFQNQILECCADVPEREFLRKVFTQGLYIQDPKTGTRIPSSKYKYFYNMEDILTKVGRRAKTSKYVNRNSDIYAVCNNEMFKHSGRLKILDHVNTYRNIVKDELSKCTDLVKGLKLILPIRNKHIKRLNIEIERLNSKHIHEIDQFVNKEVTLKNQLESNIKKHLRAIIYKNIKVESLKDVIKNEKITLKKNETLVNKLTAELKSNYKLNDNDKKILHKSKQMVLDLSERLRNYKGKYSNIIKDLKTTKYMINELNKAALNKQTLINRYESQLLEFKTDIGNIKDKHREEIIRMEKQIYKPKTRKRNNKQTRAYTGYMMYMRHHATTHEEKWSDAEHEKWDNIADTFNKENHRGVYADN
jgi:hypothetical protein